jgi:D-alanyl-D-alanine carboxypeptidase
VGGLGEGKMAKVVGLAAMVPFNKEDPRHPINRRIAIIVMNKATEAALLNEGAKVASAQEAEQAMNGEAPVDAAPQETPVAAAPAKVSTAAPKEMPKKEAPAEPPKKESKSIIGSVKINRQSPKVELAPEQAAKEGDISPIPAINPIQLPVP